MSRAPEFVRRKVSDDPEVLEFVSVQMKSKAKGGMGLSVDEAAKRAREKFGARAEPSATGVGAGPPPGDVGGGAAAVSAPSVVPSPPSTPAAAAPPDPMRATTTTPSEERPPLHFGEGGEAEEDWPEEEELAGTANPKSLVGRGSVTPSEIAAVSPPRTSPLEVALQWLDALSYEGFNPAACRMAARETMDWGSVLRVVAIYIRVGNSASKRLGKKVKDRDVAADARQLLSEVDIKRTGSTGSTLTLPRVAQVLAPVTLFLRKAAAARGMLDIRVETTTPIEFQDVAFNGIYSEADDYCIKFGRVLGIAAAIAAKQTFDQAVCDARNAGFKEVARAGLLRDVDLAQGKLCTTEADLRRWFEAGPRSTARRA
jgi:hypothetical protein